MKFLLYFFVFTSLILGAKETVNLRSSPKELNKFDVREMVLKYNFFSKNSEYDRDLSHPDGNFSNGFELKKVNDKPVVIDNRTGLMWQAGGSDDTVPFDDAVRWIDALNKDLWAGFSDWRMPTLEEAASLLENKPKNGNLHIDTFFQKDQSVIWTADPAPLYNQWVIHFVDGSIYRYIRDVNESYVRSVRSIYPAKKKGSNHTKDSMKNATLSEFDIQVRQSPVNYDHAVKTLKDMTAATRNFISSVEKSIDSDSMLRCIIHYGDVMADIAPEMNRIEQDHPEFKHQSEPPEPLKALAKEMEVLILKVKGLKKKIEQFLNQKKFEEAYAKLKKQMPRLFD
jgi:hypothetical protein